jgi:hypothetical protein
LVLGKRTRKRLNGRSLSRDLIKTPRTILQLLLLAALAETAAGEGITYPDGSVSPYKPGFFGIGHIEPFRDSVATAVAAQKGVVLRVAAYVNNPIVPGGKIITGIAACYFDPRTGQLYTFPGNGTADSSTSGVSKDGVLTVGRVAGQAVVWDGNNNNNYTLLGNGDATAITPDGLTIVGNTGSGSNSEATRWKRDGTGWKQETLGFLSGFDGSAARAVTADGQIVVGEAFNSQEARDAGGSKATRAFLKRFTSPLEDLGTRDNFSSASAFGISDDSNVLRIVGRFFGKGGVVMASEWVIENMINTPFTLDHVFSNTPQDAAYAISRDANAIYGVLELSDGSAAYRWTFSDDNNSTIRRTAHYEIPASHWQMDTSSRDRRFRRWLHHLRLRHGSGGQARGLGGASAAGLSSATSSSP